MAKKNIVVVAENGVEINVMSGANQQSFVDGDVWRFPSELYADISAISGITVSGVTPTDTTRFYSTLGELLRCFNKEHKSELVAENYDVARGKFNKAELKQARISQPTEQPTATAINSPVMATADKTNPMNVWIGEQFQSGQSEEQIIATLKAQKWTDEQLKPYFKSMQTVAPPVPKAPSVPVPPQ